jgi:type IV pilus assembly protein PilW
MNKKAFTLIEILITLVILGIVMSAVYITFINTLKDYKIESNKIGTQIEKNINTSIIRLDIEHAGFGLSRELTDLPLEWDNSTNTFIIRSTINSTNVDTFDWALYDCDNSTPSLISGVDLSGKNVVLLDPSTDELKFISNTTLGSSCPTGYSDKPILAYRYDSSVTDGCSSAQICNKITYHLSSSQTLTSCNPNTYNLLRGVGASSGFPILNCVAGFTLKFLWWDTSTSSLIKKNSIPNDAASIRANLKRVDFYVLLQEGGKDTNFTYPTNTISQDDVTFTLPSGYEHYRWKILKISVKPMNL